MRWGSPTGPPGCTSTSRACRRSCAGRLARLAATWLHTLDWTTLTAVAGAGGPLQLYYRISPWASSFQPLPQAGALRQLVARIAGRLAPDATYSFSSLVDLLWRVAPKALGQAPPTPAFAGWWFVARDRPDAPIDLDTRAEWERVYGALVAALLAGPLTWLGAVEGVEYTPGGDLPASFRVLPAAGVLLGRDVADRDLEQPATVAVADDLAVDVRGGGRDGALFALLSRAGEPTGAAPGGVRYRLFAEGVHEVFDAGLNGAGLVDALARRAPAGLPAAARATIERWWQQYGTVRLYDELTLIELADDLILRELLATTSLSDHIVATYSPRTVAVATDAVDGFVAELTRLGHAPRVVEEG